MPCFFDGDLDAARLAMRTFVPIKDALVRTFVPEYETFREKLQTKEPPPEHLV